MSGPRTDREPASQRVVGYCTLCRSRCGSTNLISDGRLIGVEPLAGHPTGGALCAKGRAAPELVHSPRRLTKPLKRTAPRGTLDPGWREISWDEALDEIAARLREIRTTSGAEAVAFAMTTPSGTPIVDSFDWVERFVRCFGSPNLIYAVEICGWHKDYAHKLTFGRGIGFPDYDHADAIVLWGHNPARTWLAQATRIADARRRGARVAVVDPKPNGSGQDADVFLRIRPGADGALAMGAIRHLISSRTFNADFARRWTNAPMLVDTGTGRLLRAAELWPDQSPDAFVVVETSGAARPYDARIALADPDSVCLSCDVALTSCEGQNIRARTAFNLLVEAADEYTIDRVADLTWLGEPELSAFYKLFENGPRLAYHSWTGVGQHTNATATERAIATLYALTGACDRAGGNVWAVTPPVNVVNDYAILSQEQQKKALGLAELPLGPPKHGWITARDFSRAVIDEEPYRVRALMSFGANFIVSQGHSSRNRDALQKLEFHVHVDMFANPTAENADILLPATLPWEHEALKLGFEITQEAVETIQFRPRMVEPLGQSRPDYEIVAELARRLDLDEFFFGSNIEAGWNHQLAPLGLSVQNLRAYPSGIRIPQPFRYEKYADVTADGSVAGFATRSRRAEIYSELMHEHRYGPLPGYVEPAESPFDVALNLKFPLVLTTAKSGWFIHSSHRHVASLRKKSPDPTVEIHPGLALNRQLEDGDWAVVETLGGDVRLRVRLNPALDERVVLAEYGWWEDCPPLGRERIRPIGPATSNINQVLTDDNRDPVSGSVPLRATICNIRRDETLSRGRWSGRRSFEVVGVRNEASNVVAVTLAPRDNKPLPAFRPGQHVRLSLPGSDLSRAYSLTGGSADAATFAIGVKRKEASEDDKASVSHRIHALANGDEVMLEGPSGVFTPPLESDRPIVLLAAGIGITPFMSYLETMAAMNPTGRFAEVLLLYGCRNGDENPFASRLRELVTALPRLTLITAFSAPRQLDNCPRDYAYAGRLNLEPVAALRAARPLIYLCGSSDFITSITGRLVERGIPRFDILAEAFVSPPVVPAELKPQTVHIAGTGRSFLWSPEQGTLLDAALSAGLQLASGCRVGQCESCAMRIVQGQVVQLGDSETDPERCLTCQAVPLSELILAN